VLITFRSFAVTGLFVLQKGPPSGKDKVKKGGSFMCTKVSSLNVIYYF
jgi:hypothetical protein